MEFRLNYRGPLKANGGPEDKHRIRCHLHSQLKELWSCEPLTDFAECLHDPPLAGKISVIEKLGSRSFAPLVTPRLYLVCSLNIVMLRPGAPGAILSGADIDNRLKTLFDALRCPQNENELPRANNSSDEPNPLFCLLQDDSLITSVNVACDRLLDAKEKDEVLLLMHVSVKVTRLVYANIGIGG